MNTGFLNDITSSTTPQYRYPRFQDAFIPFSTEFSISKRGALVLMYFNFLSWAYFLYSTILTVGDVYHSRKETYLSPAPWAYFIWVPIHFFLLGFLLYQFTANGKIIIIDNVLWGFIAFALLSSAYIRAWITEYYGLAFIFLLLVISSVYSIRQIIKDGVQVVDGSATSLLYLPFSLIDGWLSVLFCVSAFEFFGPDSSTYKAGFLTKTFVFLCLFGLHIRAVLFALNSNIDTAANIAIAWSSFAIYAKQSRFEGDGFVITYSLFFAILCLFWCGFSLFKSWYAILMSLDISHDQEIASLPNDLERTPIVNEPERAPIQGYGLNE